MTDCATKILENVRALLRDSGAWIKGEFAASKDGAPVPLGSPSACRWCLIGAINQITQSVNDGNASSSAIMTISWAIREVVDHDVNDIVDFNDHPSTTHADVLKVLDRAIEMSRQA